MQLFEPREFAGSHGVLKFRLLKPMDFDPAETYPLVLFLHGAGERGADNSSQLVHGMSDFCRADRREKFRCYVLAPQCPEGQKWADIDWSAEAIHIPANVSPTLQLVFELLDTMKADAAIDDKRIYVTGLSMGGYGTWDAIYRRPDFFAAALPICGGYAAAGAETIQQVPIWCFHGDQDQAVNVERSREIVNALRAAGGQPRYTEYNGVGHNSWSATYANDEVYEWLFAQRKVHRSHH